MADVFLSYAQEDRERARHVANAFEASGWSVWWDRDIVTGESFDQTIERELERAKSVVVLWSDHAVASEWVKSEAAVASERGVLVPAQIDDVRIPLEFRRRQTANLIDWDGDTSHEGFCALREGVAARIGAAGKVPAAQPPAPTRAPSPWRRHGWKVAAAVVVAASGAVGYLVWDGPSRSADGSGIAARTGDVRVAPAEGNDIDHPAPLPFGVTHKVTLEPDEEYYFRLADPANAITIVQDVRLLPNRIGNLQTNLSVLDEAGAIVESSVVRINEIDRGFRKTAEYSTKRPTRLGFKVVNTASSTSDIWLTVAGADADGFLPFFGETVPQPMSVDTGVSGALDTEEDVFFVVPLPAGEYRAILDFANARRERTNLQGSLAMLDADGGNQEQIMRMNEIQVTHRQVGMFSTRRAGSTIVRLLNRNAPVTFTLRIAPAQ